MKRAGCKEIAVLLVCVSIPCWFSYRTRLASGGHIRMIDFGALYFGARCAVQHIDPYNPTLALREFEADGGRFAPPDSDEDIDRIVVTRNDNLPTALSLTIPFALLPWWLAQNLWMILTAVLLVTAAFLTWDLGAGEAPILWVALAGFMLAESDLLFRGGNVAGIVISFCVIAVWCFLKQRYVWLGVILIAVSLVLKPQDSGFAWLYFLLAGGTLRKRALQAMAVTGVLALSAVLWLQPVSPLWVPELHQNLHFLLAHGGASDPGPAGMSTHTAAAIIDMQAALSGFKDDPSFYDPFTWLMIGLPIFAWAVASLRKPSSPQGQRLALAAISALTLLPTYHRINDAIILLLALPACAMLWKEPGPIRWFAVGLTSAGILLTATTPMAFLAVNAPEIIAFAAQLPGKLLPALVLHPTPFVLLAMGCFYLWLYLRYDPSRLKDLPAPATITAADPA